MPGDFHKHIRLRGHDYTSGIYFVTLCTNARTKVFGSIVDINGTEKIELSEIGRIIEECWRMIPQHFPNARIGEMQIMPDHLHGILILGVDLYDHDRQSTRWIDATRPNGPRRGSLGAMIGAFKSETTKRANRSNNSQGERLWQPGYYERIIREGNDEYARIARYIADNTRNWQ